jgi:TonB-linked SusC/RagA family outer membrane protein
VPQGILVVNPNQNYMHENLRWFEKTVFFRTVLLVLTMVLFQTGNAQSSSEHLVKGRIVDATSGAVPGASILIVGTSTGTVTDTEGNFSLTIPNASGQEVAIEISFIGFKSIRKTIKADAGQTTSLNDVSLESDILSLDEVVVIGSTVTMERRKLGNSITSIKGNQLTDRGTGNLVQAMQGKVAGAQISQNSGDPSGGISVKLRGAKSLLSSSEPLYVIDGVVVSNATKNVTNVNVDPGNTGAIGQNSMADINPNDIESIEIINGAAASAIYGSRASNGVVLITTKRGKSGVPEIQFSASFNVNELRKRVYITKYGKQFGSAALRLNTIADTDTATPGTQLASNLVDVQRYDYQDNIFRTGYGTDNNVSIRGGNDKTTYYASFNYLFNQGIVENADYRRYNGKVRVDQNINSWINISAGVNFINGFSNEKPNGNVFWSPVNSVNITNNIYNITERDAFGNLKAVEPTRINPLSAIETFDITQETNRTISNLQLNLTPLDGLTISYLLGVDNINQQGRIFIPPYPYTGVNATFFNDGYAASAIATTLLINNDINASYDKTWEDFSSVTQAGFSHQYSKEGYTQAHGRKLATFVKTVDGAATPLPSSNTLNIFDVYGFYLQETLGYKNKLFLTLAGRIDGSTAFAKDNRNLFYPKASVSYLVSESAWWNTLGITDIVSQFKLRSSYGEAGNLTGIAPYDRFNLYTAGSFVGSNYVNANATLANLDVKPERQKEIEIGTDISFFKNRLSLSVNYYHQRIEDLSIERTLAPSQGGSNIRTNVGKLENKGIELSLNATAVKTEAVTWNVYGTFSRNRNKVTESVRGRISISNPTGAPVAIISGQPVGVFYGYYYARNEDGSLLLTDAGLPQQEKGTQDDDLHTTPARDANGQPTGTILRKVIGNPNPDFIWSLGSTVDYKNFSVGFLLDAVQGNDVFNADKRTRQGVGIGDYAEKEYKGELPRGYINAVYPIEEFRIDDGSYVKIREVSLSYRLPNILKGVRNLQFTLTGRNLYSFDDYNGYDPETNAAGQSSTLRGIDFGNVPIPRSYQFMVKANF